jgi:DNA-binding FadR family transcriptional regulator
MAHLRATERVPLDKGIRVRRLLNDRRSVGATKSALRVAMGLVKEIVEASPNEAANLGSELDIGLRHSANAEIVRQAIRLLEDLGVASPRRGRYGGLEPREPDAASIIGLIPHILIRDRLKISDCFDAAGLLKVEMAMTAAAIGEAGWGPKAQAARDAVGRAPDRLHSVVFERAILDLIDNSVLTACERGFLMYACNVKPVTETDAVPVAAVERISSMTRRVVERILEGDVDGAEAAAFEKHRSLALRFSPSPTGLSENSACHPLSVVGAPEQELLAAGLRT